MNPLIRLSRVYKPGAWSSFRLYASPSALPSQLTSVPLPTTTLFLVDLFEMLLVWVAYTFFYTTVLWFHLNAPYISTDDFIPALTETSASAPIPIPTPPIIVPISPRIPIPDTIIFPASPLPTARLLHKALPLCHDGLHDELPRFAGTRTSRAKTESVVNSPSLRMRHPLVALNLASALGHSLTHGIVGLALVFVSGLVCASWVLFMVRRTVFVVAAPHSRVSTRTLSQNRELMSSGTDRLSLFLLS